MEDLTIRHLVDPFISSVILHLSKNTVRAYKSDITHAASSIQKPLREITSSDLEEYFYPNAPARNSTNNRRRSSLNCFFEWAVKTGILNSNPVNHCRLSFRPRLVSKAPLNDNDRAAILFAISHSQPPYQLIFHLLCVSGLSLGSLLRLRLMDVGFSDSYCIFEVRDRKRKTPYSTGFLKEGIESIFYNFRTYYDLHGKEQTNPLKSFPFRGSWRRMPEIYSIPLSNLLFCHPETGKTLSNALVHYHWRRACQLSEVLNEEGQPRYTLSQLCN